MKILYRLCFFVLAIFALPMKSGFAGDASCKDYLSEGNPFKCGSLGNCVWWAVYKRPDLKAFMRHNPIDVQKGTDWYNEAEAYGFDVGQRPRAGSVAVFSKPSHVAYVESVSDNGSFSASEMDWYGSLGTHDGVQYSTYKPVPGGYKRVDGVTKSSATVWKTLGFIYPKYCEYLNSDVGAFCWNGSNGYYAECLDGFGHAAYKRKSSGSGLVVTNLDSISSMQYCVDISNGVYPDVMSVDLGAYGNMGKVTFAAYGGWAGTVTDGIGSGSDSFNLKVNDFRVVDAAGSELNPGSYQLTPGETIVVKVQVKAKYGDTHDHMRDGKDRIEIDLYKRYGAGEWKFLKRERIKATNLPSGATHSENVELAVPNTNQEPLSFKAKIDAEDEAMEANEGDNWSRIETFSVGPDLRTVDLTVTAIQLSNTSIPVPAGGQMGAKMAIRNIGPYAPDVGIQSDYLVSGPGIGQQWVRIAGDASEAYDLVPGRDQWEEIKSLVAAPTVPGTYTLFGCTDVGNVVAETDENNNCLSTTFEVVAPRPDFIITAVGPAGGKMSFKKGSKINPAMYIKNVGNAGSPARIQSSYFYSGPATGNAWAYITGDNTEANELCVGCQMREQYDSGMKINTRGTYYFMGCADVNNTVAESDESNNCTVSGSVSIY